MIHPKIRVFLDVLKSDAVQKLPDFPRRVVFTNKKILTHVGTRKPYENCLIVRGLDTGETSVIYPGEFPN